MNRAIAISFSNSTAERSQICYQYCSGKEVKDDSKYTSCL